MKTSFLVINFASGSEISFDGDVVKGGRSYENI